MDDSIGGMYFLSCFSSIMDDDDAGHPSLFVVVHYDDMEPPYFSILQIETQQLEDRPSIHQMKKRKVEEEKCVIRFNPEPDGRPRITWLFSPPTSSTDQDLYLVPNWGYAGFILRTVKPLEGYKFNLGTGMCEPILRPLLSSELEGRVVKLGGRIYLLGYDSERYKHSVFQCYDPDENSWKALEPCPHNRASLGRIVATAALGNTILFNIEYRFIWAYDVIKSKWYEVGVEDKGCYFIEGEAVAVGDTIYALTREPFNLVLALYIEKKPNDGDLVLKCSSKNLVQGMVPINDLDNQEIWRITRHLVHMGKDNFCLVQSCKGCQAIKLTYAKLNGDNSVIMGECIQEVKGQVDEKFDVLLCFALPKGATAAFKEGKIFNKKPFPVLVEKEGDDEDNAKIRRNILDDQLQGCPDMSRQMLEMDFEKDEERRLAYLTQGDRYRTQAVGSSSYGQNDLENHDSIISQVSRLLNAMQILKARKENIQKEEESMENALKNLRKEKEAVENALKNLRKEKEAVENALKNLEKEKCRFENDLTEAVKLLDLMMEKGNAALRGPEEANKQKSSMSFTTTTEYEEDQVIGESDQWRKAAEEADVEEEAIDSKHRMKRNKL